MRGNGWKDIVLIKKNYKSYFYWSRLYCYMKKRGKPTHHTFWVLPVYHQSWRSNNLHLHTEGHLRKEGTIDPDNWSLPLIMTFDRYSYHTVSGYRPMVLEKWGRTEGLQEWESSSGHSITTIYTHLQDSSDPQFYVPYGESVKEGRQMID